MTCSMKSSSSAREKLTTQLRADLQSTLHAMDVLESGRDRDRLARIRDSLHYRINVLQGNKIDPISLL
jgi:hypothetical protein